mmetsp:Transcript_2722/g.11673  ORF Transcript_2722/g.11673 Transcript_2722/m.11673 type:complete len:236 (+) Transcript_2722:151-858(+)
MSGTVGSVETLCNQLVNWGYSPRGPGASAGSRGRAMTAGSSARRALARLARARFPPGRARVPAPAFASSSSNQPHWEGGGGGGAPNQGRRDRGANVPPAASDPRASSFAARAWISSEADAVADAAAPTERKKSPKSRKNGGGTSANGRTARTENGGPVVELWGDDADGGVDVPPPPPQRQAQQQQQMRGETLSCCCCCAWPHSAPATACAPGCGCCAAVCCWGTYTDPCTWLAST